MKLKNIALGKVFATVLLAAGLAFSGAASADPTPVNGTALQDILNNVGLSSYDDTNSQIEYDEVWSVSATGAVERILHISSAIGGTYEFGIYDVDNTSNVLKLMDQTYSVGDTQSFSAEGNTFKAGGPGGATAVFSSAYFGYYLKIGTTTYYFSESGANGGTDVMVAYKGDGSSTINVNGSSWGTFDTADYLLAWDTDSNFDFADWLVLVESVTPVTPPEPGVPEPGTFALLGIGLVGLGAIRRHRRA